MFILPKYFCILILLFLPTAAKSKIAILLNISELIIGLTIIAIGTSLPELAATISAVIKKKTDMVVGNVIGSNVLNITLVVPIIGLFSSILLWGDLTNIYIWFLIYIVGAYGLLGAFDDYKKIKQNNSSGISSRLKIILQILIALVGVSFFIYMVDYQDISYLYFPFFKNLIIDLGWFFIPFSIFVIVGSSNAVNLTDGLDGLATVPVILVAACFAFISYVTGNVVFSDYLQIPYIEGTGEISIFCGAIIGSVSYTHLRAHET